MEVRHCMVLDLASSPSLDNTRNVGPPAFPIALETLHEAVFLVGCPWDAGLRRRRRTFGGKALRTMRMVSSRWLGRKGLQRIHELPKGRLADFHFRSVIAGNDKELENWKKREKKKRKKD